MLRGRLTVLLCLALALAPRASWATAYMYRDLDGRTTFTDVPMHGDVKLVKRYDFIETRATRQRIGGKVLKTRYEALAPMIDAVAARFDLNPNLLHAVILVESGYDSAALSPAGAAGLMQLMPDTATRFGVSDRWDVRQNLEGGARYLVKLKALFQDDLKLVLAAYNAGEGAVQKYGNRIPPYDETQHYVVKVLEHYGDGRISPIARF